MPIRNSIVIAADLARVWPLVADPAMHKEWNPKIVSVDRNRSGPARMGEAFAIVYRMSGTDSECRVLVIACEEMRRIGFQQRSIFAGAEQIALESYELTETPQGVRVTQSNDFSRAGIPWFFRALMWLVNRFGSTAEEPCLYKLKSLAENNGQLTMDNGQRKKAE